MININLDGLSKPGMALVEKISSVIGGTFPKQIIENAKAEAEAKIIHAKADAGVEVIRANTQNEVLETLQRGTIQRLLHEEMWKQKNMSQITEKAISAISEKAEPEKIEDDWLAYFFDKCRIISNSEMQSLWARILADEANNAGAFSKRTINLVASLEKADAELFTSLCRFNWSWPNKINPIVFNVEDEIYKAQGITFESLTHLHSIGLIYLDNAIGFIADDFSDEAVIYYHKKPYLLKFPENSKKELFVGKTLFTKSGYELATIVSSEELDNFPAYAISKWKNQKLFAHEVDNLKDISLIVE